MRAKLSLMTLIEMRRGDGNGSAGGLEARMESADRQHEIRVVAEIHQQAHLAVERDEQDARFEERREEPDAALVELDARR